MLRGCQGHNAVLRHYHCAREFKIAPKAGPYMTRIRAQGFSCHLVHSELNSSPSGHSCLVQFNSIFLMKLS